MSCECGLYSDASSIFVYAFTLNPIFYLFLTTDFFGQSPQQLVTEFHRGFFFNEELRIKTAKLMRALPELMKNWPCGMLPRSFANALDDNKVKIK